MALTSSQSQAPGGWGMTSLVPEGDLFVPEELEGGRRAVHFGAGAPWEGGRHKGQQGARQRADAPLTGKRSEAELQPQACGTWGTSPRGTPTLSPGCTICRRARLPADARVFSTEITVESMSFAGTPTWVRVPALPFTSSACRQITSALRTFQSSGSSGESEPGPPPGSPKG